MLFKFKETSSNNWYFYKHWQTKCLKKIGTHVYLNKCLIVLFVFSYNWVVKIEDNRKCLLYPK